MGRIAIVGDQDGLAGRISAALAPSGHVVTVARSVHERRADTDVVVVATSSPAALDAAVAAAEGGSWHLVMAATDPATVRRVCLARDADARAVGRRIVPAAGPSGFTGDLVGAVASDGLLVADEVHVAYALPGAGGPLPRVPAHLRRRLAGRLQEPAIAYVDGRHRDEATGQERRLAWFPRPLGPRHVVGIPAPEPLTLPLGRPGVATVRTYLAMPTWQAEGLQLAAATARWRPARRVLQTVAGWPPRGHPSGTRWGCVAEARRGDDLVRAWAYGSDLVGLAAATLSLTAERVLDDSLPAGVLSAAQLGAPGDLLDELSARSDTRWATRRPDGT